MLHPSNRKRNKDRGLSLRMSGLTFSQGPPKRTAILPNRNVTFFYNKGLTSLRWFRRKLAQGGQCLPLVYSPSFGGQNAEHRRELLTRCVPRTRRVPQQAASGDGWTGKSCLSQQRPSQCLCGLLCLWWETAASSPAPQQIPLEVSRGGGCNQTG